MKYKIKKAILNRIGYWHKVYIKENREDSKEKYYLIYVDKLVYTVYAKHLKEAGLKVIADKLVELYLRDMEEMKIHGISEPFT